MSIEDSKTWEIYICENGIFSGEIVETTNSDQHGK